MRKNFFILVLCFASGCQSAGTTKSPVGSTGEAAALGTVVGAISGQNVDQEQLHKTVREIRRDPEARQAVEAMTRSMGGTDVKVKYCPVDGKRYSPSLKICPEHGIELKPLEE